MVDDPSREDRRPRWLQRVVPRAILPWRSLPASFAEGLSIGLATYVSYELLLGLEYVYVAERQYALCVLPELFVMKIYLATTGGLMGYVFLWRSFKSAHLSHKRIARAFGVFSAIFAVSAALPLTSAAVETLPPEQMALRAAVVHTLFPFTTALTWMFLNSFKWLPGLLSAWDQLTTTSRR